jgi:glycosyltransferase involved in cell wall biosynthesis
MHIKSAAPKPPVLYPWSALPAGKIPIGVIDPCYGSSRVVYGLHNQRYAHVTLPRLPLTRLDRSATFFKFTPVVMDWRVPLLHTWNSVPVNKDFLMSFELDIPRYLGSPSKRMIRFALDRMSGRRCRRLLALSEFARRHALRVFATHGYDHLAQKLAVFRGGVQDPFDGGDADLGLVTQRGVDSPLTAILIGTELFRKGGMYSIEAFERLRQRGVNVHLTLVGDFEDSCYAFREALPDRDVWRRRAASHDWITVLQPVPFAEVFKLLLTNDVCLYPSLDESLGWLPIEAAMAGKPVIGTRIAAFPEFIRHEETGWLIDIPTGDNERWNGIFMSGQGHRNALEEARVCMVDGIEQAMLRLNEDRSLATRWGQAGRGLMRRLYDIQSAAATLDQIYDEALGPS